MVFQGCDNTLKSARSSDITASPSSLTFGKLAPGAQAEAVVEIGNPGTASLIISHIALDVGPTPVYDVFLRAAAGEDTAGLLSGVDHFDYPLRVAQRASIRLVVRFRPQGASSTGGALVLTTNAVGASTFRVPIMTADSAAEIAVTPPTVDFGRVSPGGEHASLVTISNVGQLPLHIQGITLSGSTDFAVRLADPATEMDDPDADGEPGLAPGASFAVSVRYAPGTEGPDAATLVIRSDDPLSPTFGVALLANGAAPCVRVLPEALEFPASLVDREDSRDVLVESCGGAPLKIEGIELAPGSDGAFTLDADSLPALPAVLPAVAPDTPPAQRPLRVRFHPSEARAHQGKLSIRTNDPAHPTVSVTLLGRGVENACPQARVTRETYFVEPTDVVTLDASSSLDPDGGPNARLRYHWTVIDRPQGATAQPAEGYQDPSSPRDSALPDDETTAGAVFYPELAGTYEIALRVTDNLGLDSDTCGTTAYVTIVAKPKAALHVQLVWTTSGDPDQTDGEGTDLDLHVMRPSSEDWFAAPDDCYYGDPHPNWGDAGTDDDPVLDLDDTNGTGPESIHLVNPENTTVAGAPYRIGVHAYKSTGRATGADFGGSKATVRVFLRGELAAEFTDIALPTQDTFCEVAAVEWPAATVAETPRCFDARP